MLRGMKKGNNPKSYGRALFVYDRILKWKEKWRLWFEKQVSHNREMTSPIGRPNLMKDV